MSSSTKETVLTITVAARSSPLSRVQVNEVFGEISQYAQLHFEPHFLESAGDKDLKSSLRVMDKTDFFTRELDSLVLEGKARIGIHSAKDLPEPLPEGLEIVAITKGVDNRDSLVFRDGLTWESLPEGARIATSSHKREQTVKGMGKALTFGDIRGSIHQRLEQLGPGAFDAVVIAEAALIRLGLTHLPRIFLPGETTKYQGQLAIIARAGDEEMKELFANIDIR